MGPNRLLSRMLAAIGAGISGAVTPQHVAEKTTQVVKVGKSEAQIAQQEWRKSPERAKMIAEARAMVYAELRSRPEPKRVWREEDAKG